VAHHPSACPTPNLFIVGAPKCGTTSLYEYLRHHPQVFFPYDDEDYSRVKEPNYFCPELEILEKDAISDREEYLALYRASEAAVWRGDASTNHLFSETAAARIKQFCPEARILVMLRPPVEWMHSYHSELLRHQHEDIADFHEAIAACAERRAGRRIPARTSVPRCLDYLAMSRFAPQLERYYDAFGRAAVKVVLLEDIAAAPAETFRDILAFLGVDTSYSPEFHVFNETPRSGRLERMVTAMYKQAGVKHVVQQFVPYPARRRFLSLLRRQERKHAPPDPRDAALHSWCAPDVERLSALIDRDLSHWQTAPQQRHHRA
jgi:hypothetical protein